MENKKVNVKEALINFWNKHKVAIMSGIGFVAGAVITNMFLKYELETNDSDDVDALPYSRSTKLVDEDIFTRIAPMIESAVLEEGLDESYMEATYDVEHPRFGDESKGMYTEKKKLEVKVYDITEP